MLEWRLVVRLAIAAGVAAVAAVAVGPALTGWFSGGRVWRIGLAFLALPLFGLVTCPYPGRGPVAIAYAIRECELPTFARRVAAIWLGVCSVGFALVAGVFLVECSWHTVAQQAVWTEGVANWWLILWFAVTLLNLACPRHWYRQGTL